MKSHFKCLLIATVLACSTKAFSRDVILIENLATEESGQMLLNIIQKKFNIPRKLITYRSVNKECMKTSDSIMQLCLKANGEMDIVKINKFVIENTFRIFLETEG
ncbi:hypothetical protein SHI21_16025 [Bacteriovorax sp. PP10]|uniref:Uncharacterized protein n=1 Tax=Bacteriovorax antarcticus TaxID=3088717 RepID=A0ABU5VXE9_9BACT|nr:hypothetical protein [Bacteriovorax sp. PP10]MEA9357739.1 hypothetical protein [Bacteriovorax sp. PP10]